MLKLKRSHKGHDQPSDHASDGEQLNALLNNMTDAVLAIDGHANVVLTNSAAMSLLNANNVTGKRLQAALPLVDRAGKPIEIENVILSSQSAFNNSDWLLKYSDGSTLNLFLSASPVHSGYGSNSGGGYVIIFRDITKEKTIEEERAEFVSVASHELRAPLAVAEGSISNAQMLSQRTPVSDDIKKTLAAAHEQIMFLGSLVNDLSMLSRAERGNLSLVVEVVNVAEMLQSLIHDYEPQATQKGLIFRLDLSPEVTTLITGRLYLREILQNFVTNALKYTPQGSITISATKLSQGVQFSVSDTGIGIGQSEQSKLFAKFFRSDDTRVRKISGTGLGLYISIKLAKLLGGSIEMVSELDKGSTFRLNLHDLKLTEHPDLYSNAPAAPNTAQVPAPTQPQSQ